MSKSAEIVAFLGGSSGHVPFIDAARDLGYECIVFDRNPECACAEDLDLRFYEADLTELQFILKTLVPENVAGVFTWTSIPEVWLVVATLRQVFDLPGPTWSDITDTADKRIWMTKVKSALDAWGDTDGFRIPEWLDLKNFSFCDYITLEEFDRFVVKPAWGTGSRGVSIQTYSPYHSFTGENNIAQKFVDGKLYSIDGVATLERTSILSVTGKTVTSSLLPESFKVVNLSPDKLAKLLAYTCDVVDDLYLFNTFFSLDVIEDSDGAWWLIDVGPMLDVAIDRMLSHNGVPVYEYGIRAATDTLYRSFGELKMAKEGGLKLKYGEGASCTADCEHIEVY